MGMGMKMASRLMGKQDQGANHEDEHGWTALVLAPGV